MRSGGCGYIDFGSLVPEVCGQNPGDGAYADGYSEISPAKERGRFVTMNHIGFVAGLAAGLW